MTAYALKGDKEKCVQSGMDDYLSKPFHIKSLTRILETYLLKEKSLLNVTEEPNIPIENSALKISTIDMDRLNEIFGNDHQSIAKFLEEFVKSSQLIIEKIKTALDKNDNKEIKDFFHQLKGSAGNSGATQIHILSKQAEEKTLANELNAVRSILKIIENNLSVFREISHQRESNTMEWIIIILILVEVFDLLISKLS